MRIIVKAILLFVTLILGTMLIQFAKQPTGHGESKGNGPFGIVIAIGMIAAMRAIWKYKPNSDQGNKSIQRQDKDDQQLDKS